jgi:ubiquinone/menaquinone biosynthesis C-methylase UbiE
MSQAKLHASELLNTLQKSGQKAVLDIGCGKVKRGTIGLDYIAGENVDIVSNLEEELPFPAGSLDGIIMYHSLEHVVNPLAVLRECRRVLKPSGTLDIKVPHHSNVSAYQIHHKTYWNYYSLDPILSQGDKSNEQEKLFTVIKKELNLTKFKSLNAFFSKRPFIYETYLYRIFPCYEIHFVLCK